MNPPGRLEQLRHRTCDFDAVRWACDSLDGSITSPGPIGSAGTHDAAETVCIDALSRRHWTSQHDNTLHTLRPQLEQHQNVERAVNDMVANIGAASSFDLVRVDRPARPFPHRNIMGATRPSEPGVWDAHTSRARQIAAAINTINSDEGHLHRVDRLSMWGHLDVILGHVKRPDVAVAQIAAFADDIDAGVLRSHLIDVVLDRPDCAQLAGRFRVDDMRDVIAGSNRRLSGLAVQLDSLTDDTFTTIRALWEHWHGSWGELVEAAGHATHRQRASAQSTSGRS